MKTAIWIIAWHDFSGDADRDVTQVALSAEDAVAAVRRILDGETVFEEIYDPEHGTFSPGEEQPAFACLFGEDDPLATLINDRARFCDNVFRRACPGGNTTGQLKSGHARSSPPSGLAPAERRCGRRVQSHPLVVPPG